MRETAATFAALGWWFPANLTKGSLNRMARDLRSLPDSHRPQALAVALSGAYDAEHLASMLLNSYSSCPFIKDYTAEIGESFTAHFTGLHRAAIATLLPVVEGVLRRLGGKHGVTVDGRLRQGLLEVIDGVIAREGDQKLGLGDERLVMLGSFRDFVAQLYARTDQFQGHEHLNRHGILHALFAEKDYGTAFNFQRLVSALDLLNFFIRIDLQVGYLLPPDLTPEAMSLATRWNRLVKFSWPL